MHRNRCTRKRDVQEKMYKHCRKHIYLLIFLCYPIIAITAHHAKRADLQLLGGQMGYLLVFAQCPSNALQCPFKLPFCIIWYWRACPFNRPFQIIHVYSKGHLKGHALQYYIKQKGNLKGHWRAFERACPSISYNTKRQFERALKGIWWALGKK